MKALVHARRYAISMVLLAWVSAATAQTRPAGAYDWSSEDGLEIRGEYVFSPDGTCIFKLEDPPLKAKIRWRMSDDKIHVRALDGSLQTYIWEGPNLRLVESAGKKPPFPVLLRRREQ